MYSSYLLTTYQPMTPPPPPNCSILNHDFCITLHKYFFFYFPQAWCLEFNDQFPICSLCCPNLLNAAISIFSPIPSYYLFNQQGLIYLRTVSIPLSQHHQHPDTMFLTLQLRVSTCFKSSWHESGVCYLSTNNRPLCFADPRPPHLPLPLPSAFTACFWMEEEDLFF